MSYDGAHSWLFHRFPHISRAHRANGKKTAMFMCRATDFQYVRGFLYENVILLPNPWTPKTSGQGQVSVGCLLGWEAEHSQSVHQPAPYGLVQNEAAVMSYICVRRYSTGLKHCCIRVGICLQCTEFRLCFQACAYAPSSIYFILLLLLHGRSRGRL